MDLLTDCPKPGGVFHLQVKEGWGGSLSALLIGVARTDVPAGPACSLLVAPPHVVVLVPLGGAGPGASSALLAGTVGPFVPSGVLDLQVFVADPAAATGLAASAGLEIVVP